MHKLFYYSEKDKNTIKKLEEILKREGSSFSEWIREQARPYVRLHELGNPQQRLDIIMFDKKAYKAPKFCGVHGCNGQAIGFAVYLPKNLKYALCKAHFKLYADSPAWNLQT